MTLLDLIKCDFERLYGPCGLGARVKHYLFNGGHPIRWVVWFRVACYAKRRCKPLFPFAWLVMRRQEFKYGVHASTDTPFGPGLLIAHGDCVYLYAGSVGENCTFYQGVTLGRSEGGCSHGWRQCNRVYGSDGRRKCAPRRRMCYRCRRCCHYRCACQYAVCRSASKAC